MKSCRHHSIIYLCTNGNEKSFLGLKALLEDGFNVISVIAYVRPVSKKTKLRIFVKTLLNFCLPVRRYSSFDLTHLTSRFGIPLIETSNSDLSQLFDTYNISKNFDILLSNGWMFKISPDIYSLSRVDALNCHSSYLPEYRGGNITYAPLINRVETTGVTVHQIKDKFDSGQIVYQIRINLNRHETPKSLNHKRALMTGQVLVESLKLAGQYDKYKPNPPSPFYFRCTRAQYNQFIFINKIRRLLGMHLLTYAPNVASKNQSLW